MGIGQSTAVEVVPKPTGLISRWIMPETTSCCSHVDIIVAMAVPAKRPHGAVSSSGALTVIHGESFPCKDLLMSANPGGGVHGRTLVSFGWVSTLGLEVANGPFTGVVAADIDLPILWSAQKNLGSSPFWPDYGSTLSILQALQAQSI